MSSKMLLEDGEEIEVTDTREERHASRKSGGGERLGHRRPARQSDSLAARRDT